MNCWQKIWRSLLVEGIILQDSIHNGYVTVAHEKLKAFVREHESKDLRVTLVQP